MIDGPVPSSIDDYIATCPMAVRPVLERIRQVIRDAAPRATEVVSYRMPAFKGHGILVYFAAFKAHIGLFPPVSGDAAIEKAIAPYAGPKGNLRFPLDEPMPYALIGRIVRLRVKQDDAKAGTTRAARSSPRPARAKTAAGSDRAAQHRSASARKR